MHSSKPWRMLVERGQPRERLRVVTSPGTPARTTRRSISSSCAG